jgi:3-methyladenine DNA glycosylase AlkD
MTRRAKERQMKKKKGLSLRGGRSIPHSVAGILLYLKAQSNARNVAGMARFGIEIRGALGVPMPVLRDLGRKLVRERGIHRHPVALGLWRSGVHEARILSALLADPARMNSRTMELWVGQVDSWDIGDQLCLNLFDRVEKPFVLALRWNRRKETFVKRAGFALMAVLAVHDKEAPDSSYLPFLRAVEREAGDERNFVKKAVNWALRQIGKRNAKLRKRSLALSRKLARSDSSSARWVGNDARRELENKKAFAIRRPLSRG